MSRPRSSDDDDADLVLAHGGGGGFELALADQRRGPLGAQGQHGRMDDAEKRLSRAQKIAPKNPQVAIALGQYYTARSDWPAQPV